jgi:hypothetical protein
LLERAVGELEATYPGVVPRSSATRRGIGPALLGNDELELVRAQIVRRLAMAQGAIDAHIEEATRDRADAPHATPARKPAPARARAKGQSGKASKRTSPAPTTRPAPAGT